MDSLYKDPQKTPEFLAGSLTCCKSHFRDLAGTAQLRLMVQKYEIIPKCLMVDDNAGLKALIVT